MSCNESQTIFCGKMSSKPFQDYMSHVPSVKMTISFRSKWKYCDDLTFWSHLGGIRLKANIGSNGQLCSKVHIGLASSDARFRVHLDSDSDSRKNGKPDSDSDSSKKSIDSIPIPAPNPWFQFFSTLLNLFRFRFQPKTQWFRNRNHASLVASTRRISTVFVRNYST